MTSTERLELLTARQIEALEHIDERRRGLRKRVKGSDRTLLSDTLGGGARLPSPADVTSWAIRAVRVVERLHPPGDVPFGGPGDLSFPVPVRRPLLLEDLGFAVLEALSQESPWRLGRYLKELERRAAPLKEEAEDRWKAENPPGRFRLPPFADLEPGGRTMPSGQPAGGVWWLEGILYGCLWGGPMDDGPARTAGELFRRTDEEGVDYDSAHSVLYQFERRDLVRVKPAEDLMEAELELTELVDPASLGLRGPP